MPRPGAPDTLVTRAARPAGRGRRGPGGGPGPVRRAAASGGACARPRAPVNPGDLIAWPVSLASRGRGGGAGPGTRSCWLWRCVFVARRTCPGRCDSLPRLARWTGEAGDPAAARDQYAELLAVEERVRGPGDPSTFEALVTTWHAGGGGGGRGGGAGPARRAAAEVERVLGPEDPKTLDTRGSLAYWTGDAGDPAAARDQFAECWLGGAGPRPGGPEDPGHARRLARCTGDAGDAAAARNHSPRYSPTSSGSSARRTRRPWPRAAAWPTELTHGGRRRPDPREPVKRPPGGIRRTRRVAGRKTVCVSCWPYHLVGVCAEIASSAASIPTVCSSTESGRRWQQRASPSPAHPSRYSPRRGHARVPGLDAMPQAR